MKPLVTKLAVPSTEAAQYLDWLARLMMLGVASSHVISAEIFTPSEAQWVLVQRFDTEEQMEAWQRSAERKKMLEELSPALKSGKVQLTESMDSADIGFISLAVVTRVKKGEEKEYLAFEREYQTAQARMPGYRGAFVQAPTPEAGGLWTALIRFDTRKSMEHWFNSEERKKLLAAAKPIVHSTDYQTAETSFPGWFPAQGSASEGPPNWKAALLILLGLYPCVMFNILYFLPHLVDYSEAVQTFSANIISVSVTTWVTMPIFIKVYDSWLFPKLDTPKWVPWASVVSILFLLALEVAFFWRFF